MEPIQDELHRLLNAYLTKNPGRFDVVANSLGLQISTIQRWAKGVSPNPPQCPSIIEVLKSLPSSKPPLAMKVMHHNDPLCKARLDENSDCPACTKLNGSRIHPPSEDITPKFYCPNCDCPLKSLRCPMCGQTFDVPWR